MAAPPEVTIGDLSGQFIMNKTLSDDTDAVLALQGISWWKRKVKIQSSHRISLWLQVAPEEDNTDTQNTNRPFPLQPSPSMLKNTKTTPA